MGQNLAKRLSLQASIRYSSVVDEGIVGCNSEDRGHVICAKFSFLQR